MMILSLADIDKSNKHFVGGKAFNISLLRTFSDNFIVAKGFSLTTLLFDKYVLHKRHLTCQQEKQQSLLPISDRAREIQTIQFADDDIGILSTILNEVKYPLIVRSSATLEDSREYSFAGLFESFPNVTNLQNLLKEIKNCWASLCTDRVHKYCIYNNININHLKMAVLVQEQVRSDKAGVIFTKYGSDIYGDSLIIETVYGHGDKLVLGEVNPQKYVVSRKDLNVASENVIHSNQHILTYQELMRLYKCGIEIESFFKYPQDIEWSISMNQIFIHQSRDLGISKISREGG
jgi:rifampicin phosphotransferase